MDVSIGSLNAYTERVDSQWEVSGEPPASGGCSWSGGWWGEGRGWAGPTDGLGQLYSENNDDWRSYRDRIKTYLIR